MEVANLETYDTTASSKKALDTAFYRTDSAAYVQWITTIIQSDEAHRVVALQVLTKQLSSPKADKRSILEETWKLQSTVWRTLADTIREPIKVALLSFLVYEPGTNDAVIDATLKLIQRIINAEPAPIMYTGVTAALLQLVSPTAEPLSNALLVQLFRCFDTVGMLDEKSTPPAVAIDLRNYILGYIADSVPSTTDVGCLRAALNALSSCIELTCEDPEGYDAEAVPQIAIALRHSCQHPSTSIQKAAIRVSRSLIQSWGSACIMEWFPASTGSLTLRVLQDCRGFSFEERKLLTACLRHWAEIFEASLGEELHFAKAALRREQRRLESSNNGNNNEGRNPGEEDDDEDDDDYDPEDFDEEISTTFRPRGLRDLGQLAGMIRPILPILTDNILALHAHFHCEPRSCHEDGIVDRWEEPFAVNHWAGDALKYLSLLNYDEVIERIVAFTNTHLDSSDWKYRGAAMDVLLTYLDSEDEYIPELQALLPRLIASCANILMNETVQQTAETGLWVLGRILLREPQLVMPNDAAVKALTSVLYVRLQNKNRIIAMHSCEMLSIISEYFSSDKALTPLYEPYALPSLHAIWDLTLRAQGANAPGDVIHRLFTSLRDAVESAPASLEPAIYHLSQAVVARLQSLATVLLAKSAAVAAAEAAVADAVNGSPSAPAAAAASSSSSASVDEVSSAIAAASLSGSDESSANEEIDSEAKKKQALRDAVSEAERVRSIMNYLFCFMDSLYGVLFTNMEVRATEALAIIWPLLQEIYSVAGVNTQRSGVALIAVLSTFAPSATLPCLDKLCDWTTELWMDLKDESAEITKKKKDRSETDATEEDEEDEEEEEEDSDTFEDWLSYSTEKSDHDGIFDDEDEENDDDDDDLSESEKSVIMNASVLYALVRSIHFLINGVKNLQEEAAAAEGDAAAATKAAEAKAALSAISDKVYTTLHTMTSDQTGLNMFTARSICNAASGQVSLANALGRAMGTRIPAIMTDVIALLRPSAAIARQMIVHSLGDEDENDEEDEENTDENEDADNEEVDSEGRIDIKDYVENGRPRHQSCSLSNALLDALSRSIDWAANFGSIEVAAHALRTHSDSILSWANSVFSIDLPLVIHRKLASWLSELMIKFTDLRPVLTATCITLGLVNSVANVARQEGAKECQGLLQLLRQSGGAHHGHARSNRR